MKNKKFKCKYNNNNIIINYCNGEIDELLMGDELEREWTVIGINDILDLLSINGYKIVKERNEHKIKCQESINEALREYYKNTGKVISSINIEIVNMHNFKTGEDKFINLYSEICCDET